MSSIVWDTLVILQLHLHLNLSIGPAVSLFVLGNERNLPDNWLMGTAFAGKNKNPCVLHELRNKKQVGSLEECDPLIGVRGLAGGQIFCKICNI